jgi:hypothetical protein
MAVGRWVPPPPIIWRGHFTKYASSYSLRASAYILGFTTAESLNHQTVSHLHNSVIYWVVTPCSLVEVHPTFRRNVCLHIKSQRVGRAINQQQASSACSQILARFLWDLEAIRSSETSLRLHGVTTRIIRFVVTAVRTSNTTHVRKNRAKQVGSSGECFRFAFGKHPVRIPAGTADYPARRFSWFPYHQKRMPAKYREIRHDRVLPSSSKFAESDHVSKKKKEKGKAILQKAVKAHKVRRGGSHIFSRPSAHRWR